MSGILKQIKATVEARKARAQPVANRNTIHKPSDSTWIDILSTKTIQPLAHAYGREEDFFSITSSTPSQTTMALHYHLSRLLTMGKEPSVIHNLHTYGIELFSDALGCRYTGIDRIPMAEMFIDNAISTQITADPTEEGLKAAVSLVKIKYLPQGTNYREELKKNTMGSKLLTASIMSLGMDSTHIKEAYFSSLALVLMSISRIGTCSNEWLSKRLGGLKEQLGIQTLFISPSEVENMWTFINPIIQSGRDVRTILQSFDTLIQASGSITIKNLRTQTSIRGLTTLTMIKEAISNHPKFAWEAAYKNFPVLAEDRKNYLNYATLINYNEFAGIEISGASSSFPAFAGLCYLLLRSDGTHKELDRYKGVGSPDNKIVTPIYKDLESWVKKYASLSQDSSILYP